MQQGTFLCSSSIQTLYCFMSAFNNLNIRWATHIYKIQLNQKNVHLQDPIKPEERQLLQVSIVARV